MTCSPKRWYLIGMCFVFKFITRFFEICIALVLSHSIDIGLLSSTLMSCNIYFIQCTCVKHVVVTMYYASIVDKEIDDCLLLNQDTRLFPRKNAPPLMLFLSSTLPTQYASM
jgi:hypothetical protein